MADHTYFFEMEGDYLKIVRVAPIDTSTMRFHVQICDHMAAIQSEYDVDVPTADLNSIGTNDLYVIANVRVEGLFAKSRDIYI